MIDTHTHLNFIAFNNNWQEVVQRAINSGVAKMIVVGTDLESSQKAVDMAIQHPALYAAVGIHPHHARALLNSKSEALNPKQIENFQVQISNNLNQLKKLAQHPKVVAIGEVGLDHHIYQNTQYEIQDTDEEWVHIKAIQTELLSRQIKLAQQLNKPLILHSREVGEDVLNLLVSNWPKAESSNLKAVFHCYDGSKKYLKKILAAGCYVSFTGNITFVPDRLEVAGQVPLDKLLLETDSPYMTPSPHRGQQNEPQFIKLIAAAHATARGISIEELINQTSQNAATLFNFSNS